MPAIQVADTLILPRLAVVLPESVERSVVKIAPGRAGHEGAGFPVYRGFAGLSVQDIDPFLMLDQLGPVLNGPFETKGAPWHPHRGFETVTYVLDGEIAHHDSHGGGGVIGDGDTQWMTAGSGILHDEVPTDKVLNNGGWQHGIQLWVNLPKTLKFSAPRYQGISANKLTLTTSHDGGALVRIIAGDIAAHSGPGSTHTPIAIAHVTLAPGAQLVVPWNPEFNAMVYMLLGGATVGSQRHVLPPHHVALFGAGGHLVVTATDQTADFLLLGGLPIREPVVQYGPFVMNTQDEIQQAFRDYESGLLGTIPTLKG
ncbi:MAG: pirin-like C-terminal cupin domain-containing protein [Actinomycetota bacterium]